MKQFVLGVDIGGTKTSIGLVDSSGGILHQDTIPTDPKNGFENFIERLLSSIHKVVFDANCLMTKIKGIGLGCPGPLNLKKGTIHNPYTLPTWDDREANFQKTRQGWRYGRQASRLVQAPLSMVKEP